MNETGLPIIYILIGDPSATRGGHDVTSNAVAQDGQCLAGHLSSSQGFARHDMGLTSDWKHDKYKEHYPGGYQLVEVEDLSDPGWLAAYEKNQALKAKKEAESK